MRTPRQWLALLALAVAVLGAPPVAEPAAAARDRLVIGITQFPSTLHPAIDSMMAKTYVLRMALRPVTAFDHDWKLVCVLCTELPSFENGMAEIEALPDGGEGAAVTYRLHPEATWGDGTPVTSADVVFTWEAGRHPQSGFAAMETYNRITGIDVLDDKTFTVHFDRVTFDYNAFGIDLLPAHIERERFEADPAAYRNRTAYVTEPDHPGLYFGPYRIVEVASGSHLVLRRNPTWYGPEPAFETVVVRAVENTSALEANLLSGQIDYIAGELGLSIDQALAFERRHGDRFRVEYKPGLIYEHIDLDLGHPALADARVRQALMHGMDRETISRQLFDGRQPVAHSNVNPLDWVHAEDVPTYAHDPARAAALLDEAGWRMGAGGLRRDAAGTPLRVTLMTTAGNRIRELVAQVLQSQWRAIGVEVRVVNQPPRVLFGDTLTRRRFDGMVMFAWISSPEAVPRTTLHSESIPTPENGWAGQNYTGYASADMDALIDAIERELDRDKRAALWRRLQHLYATDLPALPLYFRADAFVMPAWLKGVRPTGHQYPSSMWVEEWRAAE